MPTVAVTNIDGDKVGEIDISESWFGAPRHTDLIHQALVTVDRKRKQYAGRAKSRGEVCRTGAKWYRQKGTGRARHGNRGAPIFVGGGKAHGPRGERATVKMPKKMRRQALYSVLSAQLEDGRVVILDQMEIDEIRTKTMVQMLEALRCHNNVLLLLAKDEYLDQYVSLSSRNIPDLALREVPHFSVRDVLWADHIVITRPALKEMGAGGEAVANA